MHSSIDAWKRSLTIVTAPAGFGKTTLMVDALQRPGGPPTRIAWLSLDADDNEITRFLTYLATAIEAFGVGLGSQARACLPPFETLAEKAVLSALLNDLASLAADEDAQHRHVIVLDDYHHISLSAIHESVTFLLDHLPPCIHLVLIARADPPLPLPRLRAGDRLVEIRAGDLRFTAAECAAFLNDVMSLQLAPKEVEALSERTEGWIAGLQLVALSLKDGSPDAKRRFIAAFAGSNRYVLDYLAEEVMSRQPPGVQTMMMQTSLLDRLCGPLCDAVCGGRAGQEMLAELERNNLFLSPLDDERRWYRYHALFAEFLRYRLQRMHPDQVSSLHRRASQWYEENGFLTESISHRLAACDHEQAAQVMERYPMLRIGQGDISTVRAWL